MFLFFKWKPLSEVNLGYPNILSKIHVTAVNHMYEYLGEVIHQWVWLTRTKRKCKSNAKLAPDTTGSFVPRKPDIANIFYNYEKRKGGAIPVQFLYCIFPVMPDMFRSLSVKQLWTVIQLWSVHCYQSHIHPLGHCKSINGNDLGNIVAKQSFRT